MQNSLNENEYKSKSLIKKANECNIQRGEAEAIALYWEKEADLIKVKLNNDTLKKVKELEKEESVDRSTIIKKLVVIRYKDLITKKVAQKYMEGKITISEAAAKAEISIWDMEKYLVDRGFKSGYSIEDLKEEIKL